jgi:hypothetical protein
MDQMVTRTPSVCMASSQMRPASVWIQGRASDIHGDFGGDFGGRFTFTFTFTFTGPGEAHAQVYDQR